MSQARSGRTRRAVETAERRAEMLRLYTVGRLTQDEIARRYGITQPAVSKAISKALAERPVHGLDELRLLELEHLLSLEREARAVMARRHYVISAGRVVTHDEEPLTDDGPTLAAIDRLISISRQRTDIIGLKAPTRVSIEAQRLTTEIEQTIAELAALDAADDSPDP